MNKLVLNPKGRNHIRYMALSTTVMPESEKEQLNMVEAIYNALCQYGVIIYERVRSGNYSVKAVEHCGDYYVIISLRNEFNTYNNTIYEISSKDDAINIAKFVGKNMRTIMKDYKKQVLDAKDMMVELPSEGNDEPNQR